MNKLARGASMSVSASDGECKQGIGTYYLSGMDEASNGMNPACPSLKRPDPALIQPPGDAQHTCSPVYHAHAPHPRPVIT